ncbi:hypothetical protein OESDEN_02495 [Oesophagostomum dentatum]|uniref:Uncharacterized protein n=1 Tax=Oesophagostomum dentatum TaxID=61180 RepID=A0A0B1TQ47_OESDE|nr:hypothetical protein OESDEN_02495 [Oesophagostomum dentatum]
MEKEEELSNEDVTGSMFTKTLGKRLYGLGNLPGLRTIQYMGLGKRGAISPEMAANLRRFNLGLGRR